MERQFSKNMRKILLVDYMGHCFQNQPTGHSLKVLNEYKRLVCDKFEIGIAAPKSIISNTNLSDYIYKIQLPFQIDVDECNNKFFNIKLMQIKKIVNLCIVLINQHKTKEFDYIWFYNVDFMFFLTFFFVNLNRCKLVCTIYRCGFSSKKHKRRNDYIFRKVIKKMYLVVHTIDIFIGDCRKVFVPDYLYDNMKYEKYKCIEKKEKAVCLGTIGQNKNIESLIDSFSHNNYELDIVGKFRNKERYEFLKTLQLSHIKIEDTYLPEDKYYSLLAEAKYAILPYDKNEYFKRTSGVLQECLFLDTIPVTFKSILDDNNISGIGIDTIQDLEKIDFKHIDVSGIRKRNRMILTEKYGWEKNKERLYKALVE